MDGVPPEVAMVHIASLQGLALLYTVSVSVLFACQTTCRPRIKGSKRDLTCEKAKYWCLWIPFLLLVVFCELLTIAELLMINEFWTKWMDSLTAVKSSYRCTSASLSIDLDMIEEQYLVKAGSFGLLQLYMSSIFLIVLSCG